MEKKTIIIISILVLVSSIVGYFILKVPKIKYSNFGYSLQADGKYEISWVGTIGGKDVKYIHKEGQELSGSVGVINKFDFNVKYNESEGFIITILKGSKIIKTEKFK